MSIRAPFPWFGGKSRVAHLVWEAFGADVPNYVEPFAGSLAVLLGRPGGPGRVETVNDLDGFLANFWRSEAADPEAVAKWADWPVNEADLHARHLWLLGERETLTARLMGDPEFCDPKIAGWWVWGICCWIGSGWCSGNGPWHAVNGQLVHLGDLGQGVHRKLVHLGNLGRGVHRKRGLTDWFEALRGRLRRVRVCCGDWSRICGPTPTTKLGVTGVFLDPPYAAEAERCPELYREDCLTVAHDVREWAIEHGPDPLMRIALCGYAGEHTLPDDWRCEAWTAAGGYAAQGPNGDVNRGRERIWFSPHCLQPAQAELAL